MNQLFNVPHSVRGLLFYFFSIILIPGCSSIPSTSVEKPRAGIVRFSSDNLALKFSFKLNDRTFETSRGGSIEISVSEGINILSEVSYENIFGESYRKNQSPYPRNREDELLYFEFNPKNSGHIIFNVTSPTNITISSKEGLIVSSSFNKHTRAWHKLIYEPENIEVFYLPNNEEEKKVKLNFYNYVFECNIFKTVITDKSTSDLFLIRFPEYNFDYKISLEFKKGVANSTEIRQPKDSPLWLNAQVKKLANQPEAQLKFICANNLRPLQSNYDNCVVAERAERLVLKEKQREEELAKQRLDRINIIENDIKRSLLIPEFKVCESNLNFLSNAIKSDKKEYEKIYSIFKDCTTQQTEIKNKKDKYLTILLTDEGAFCKRQVLFDNPLFWECINKRQELFALMKVDSVTRECINIGFEYATNAYKDCYLKLKLHTEQIAEWRKLEMVLQKQKNQSLPSQSSNFRSESSVTSEVNYDQAEALLSIAQRSLEFSTGQNRPAPILLPLPPPPMQIITPRGNSYNCSMMGAAMRCR